MTNLNEIFRIIEDYPNYEISNFGRVRVLGTDIFRKVYNRYDKKYNKKKRQEIGFKKDKKQCMSLIHHLVMKAFGYKSPGFGYTIDHKDRDPFNNHISNLRWATKKEQTANRSGYVYLHPKKYPKQKITRSRLNNTLKKLSAEDLDKIYNRLQSETMDNISKEVGITAFNLHIILKYVHPLY